MQRLEKVGWFLLLTFAGNWALAGLFALFGGTLHSVAGLVMAVVYMFVPMSVALLVQKVWYREPVRGPLGISFRINWWFLIGWLLPAALSLGAFGVALLLPGVSYSPDLAGLVTRFGHNLSPEQLAKMQAQVQGLPILWLTLGQGLLAGATINAVAAFGEELGWRGLLQRELSFLGFWRSSLVVGLIWGVWHAPLILMGHNYPDHPVTGVFMMVDFCLLLAPLIAYVRIRAKSVLAAAIMHGTVNGTYGLGILLLAGGSDLTVGLTGVAGLAVMLAANLLLWAYDRFLAREPVGAVAWE